MNARTVTGITAAAVPWAAYLSYAAAAAHTATDITPLPAGIRGAILATLITGTVVLVILMTGRWLLAQLLAAHALDVWPRRDGWDPPPEGGCRNTPAEPEQLTARIVRPARAVGRAVVDDSPTLDLPTTVHPKVLEAGQRIAAALRESL